MNKDGSMRLGSTLTFDPQKEKDILEGISRYTSSNELSILIAHLLRLAFESPEIFGDNKEVRAILKQMDKLGMTPTRYNFFAQISKELETMKQKIDSVYDIAYKSYILAQMGKRLGLEEKADNNLMAAFILERQITDLCVSLGVSNMKHIFASNKIEDVHKKADDVLEFILESYDDIVTELKANMQPSVIMVPANGIMPTLVDKNNNNQLVGGSVGEDGTTSDGKSDGVGEMVEGEDELIELPEKPNTALEIPEVSKETANSILNMMR